MASAQELYTANVRQLPPLERLRLALEQARYLTPAWS